MGRRLRRWFWRVRLLVRYLTLDEQERQEMIALLRRQAWQARLLAGEARRLAAEAQRLTEPADSTAEWKSEGDGGDPSR
jgi:hypothetical protein